MCRRAWCRSNLPSGTTEGLEECGGTRVVVLGGTDALACDHGLVTLHAYSCMLTVCALVCGFSGCGRGRAHQTVCRSRVRSSSSVRSVCVEQRHTHE